MVELGEERLKREILRASLLEKYCRGKGEKRTIKKSV
jgi:hypothetical protein